MPQENTVRVFEFPTASAGPWMPASSSMRVQSSVSVEAQAVTLIGAAVTVLGMVSAGGTAEFSTTHGFTRLVSAGYGAAAISYSAPSGSGGGTVEPTIPANAITLAGEPITLAGDYITLGA